MPSLIIFTGPEKAEIAGPRKLPALVAAAVLPLSETALVRKNTSKSRKLNAVEMTCPLEGLANVFSDPSW
jgi:hypothetical protein